MQGGLILSQRAAVPAPSAVGAITAITAAPALTLLLLSLVVQEESGDDAGLGANFGITSFSICNHDILYLGKYGKAKEGLRSEGVGHLTEPE